MKILVSCLAYDEGKSGISDYINSTVKELVQVVEKQDGKTLSDTSSSITLLIHRSDSVIFPVTSPKLHCWFVRDYLKHPLLSMLWHLYVLPLLLTLKKYDLVFLPAGNRRLMAFYPSKTVVTFHDLSQYHVSGKYDRFRMFYIKHVVPYYLSKAPHIFAISENTKNDLIRFYHIEPSRISVNYNGYSIDKLLNPIPEAEMRSRFGIQKKYLLYISRLEHPGKNHVNLLRAYDRLPDALKAEYDLVCAGSEWNGSEVVFAVHKQMLDSKNVHFTGFVSNEEVAGLYHNASLYVFPSLYEGFGIPILEAFYCALPVACSDRASLPEIGGAAVQTFDPESPDSIAKVIEKVLANPDLQREMVQIGNSRLMEFSWNIHVKQLLMAVL